MRLSFTDVPLLPSPGESGGRYPAPNRNRSPSRLSDAEQEAIEAVIRDPGKLSDDELDSLLTSATLATKARRAATRKLYMESIETSVGDYHFEDEPMSALDFDTSFGSTDSLVETVRRIPKKRGLSTSPQTETIVADVHPAPENRGKRTAAALETPKRRKTASRQPDFDEIRAVGEEARAPLPASTKIPPIVIRDGSRWLAVKAEIERRGLKIAKARRTREGVRFFPASASDYRAISTMMNKDGHPFHTYQLPEEKLLNVVIRDIPVGVPEQEVRDVTRED